MGIEYKINFTARNKEDVREFLSRLEKIFSKQSDANMPDYFASFENDSFYFCDNCGDSSISAKAFRMLIDEALKHSEQVIIQSL